MSEEYIPPFQVTEEITDLTIEIGQYVGSVTAFETMHPNPVLRRENRIRTIHSSLAIEQNTLTLDQVTDLINGKRILEKMCQALLRKYEMFLISLNGAWHLLPNNTIHGANG